MKSYPEFQRLHLLLLKGKLQNISKASVVQTSENYDTISLITDGFIKRYFIAHDGTSGVQAIYGAGDVFPLTVVFRALFSQEIYQGPEIYYYETMTDVKLYSLNTLILRENVKADPLLYRDLLRSAGQRFDSNIQFLENLNLHGAYCKTAHQLAYFGQRFGEKTPQGIRITLPFTHQDLADIIGTTRETVTANIIKLRDKQLITSDRHITLLNVDKLIAEAYS